MNQIIDELLKERAYYDEVLRRLGEPEKIEGSLVIHKRKGNVEYYESLKDGDTRKRKYLGANDLDRVRKLAKAPYEEKIRKMASARLKSLDDLIDEYKKGSIDDAYDKISPERKALFAPVLPTISQKIEAWQKSDYRRNSYKFDTKQFITTDKGERVRSKFEKILADTLNRYGIPYKYECPILLPNGNKIYPDFTILNKRTGEEVYWEHFGMMDDPKYFFKTIEKIQTYQMLGIRLGRGLIMTFEYSEKGMDQRDIEEIIRKHLL